MHWNIQRWECVLKRIYIFIYMYRHSYIQSWDVEDQSDRHFVLPVVQDGWQGGFCLLSTIVDISCQQQIRSRVIVRMTSLSSWFFWRLYLSTSHHFMTSNNSWWCHPHFSFPNFKNMDPSEQRSNHMRITIDRIADNHDESNGFGCNRHLDWCYCWSDDTISNWKSCHGIHHASGTSEWCRETILLPWLAYRLYQYYW